MAETNQSATGGVSVCAKETISEVLEICWCKQNCNCLLGQGAYGRVYKGKWKENRGSMWKLWVRGSIDVAVKHPTGPYHVEYEIATLKKANAHANILKFYGQVSLGPNRYIIGNLTN